MSLFYKIAFRLGFTPWEQAATHPPAVEKISMLFDREESGLQSPYGRALDLGCGTGIWSVELASRGWQVTGIDIVPKAVRSARERAREAGVEVRFVKGDITALRAVGVGSGFRFVWDFGTVHGLTQKQREAVGREVSAVTADDATMLMMAWPPGRRGPLPRGASRGDIEADFPDWKVITEDAFDAFGLPGPLGSVDQRFYRMRRG